MSRKPFVWQGVEHWIMGELSDTLLLIDSQDDADDFMSAYAEVCGEDEAEHNIRYMATLVERKDGISICNLFGVDMPAENEVITAIQTFGKNGSSMGVKHENTD